jgi:hypothetical protein
MKRLIAILLCLCQPSWATWTLVQVKYGTHTTTACPVTVSAIGANHLVVICKYVGTSGRPITSVTAAGESFVTSNADFGNATGGEVSCWHTLSAVGGETTITENSTSDFIGACVVYEYSTTSGPALVDDHQAAAIPSHTNNATGITPVLSGTNDVIIQNIGCNSTCSAVTTYTNSNFVTGDGTADLENTTSTTAPIWTETGTNLIDSNNEIAFKETTAASASSPSNLFKIKGGQMKIQGGKVAIQ